MNWQRTWTVARTGQGKQLVGDIPFKLVRYITQSRKNRDHWENTQENMFCMNALIDYSRVYESEAPNMTLSALFDAEVMGQAEFTDLRDDPVTFQSAWPASRSATHRPPAFVVRNCDDKVLPAFARARVSCLSALFR